MAFDHGDWNVQRQVSDLAVGMLQRVCHDFDFRRSALFLYAYLNGSLEGVQGYNVQLTDIRRIRESEFNLPVLRQAFQTPRPMFFSEAATVFPKAYVRRFHLTSLLIFPLRDSHKEPVAFLLLDQGGERFTPDESSVSAVNTALRSLSQPLIPHLYEAASTPLSRRIPVGTLTPREQQVLQLVADGLETKDVAQFLQLSEYTVTEHIGSAMRKMDARNRTEAVATALRWRLIQ